MAPGIDSTIQIEDLRDHSAETLAALRSVLAVGTRMVPDPKRRDIYEVEGSSTVYYIHISPATGNVMLLATWPNNGAAAGAEQLA